MAKKVGYEVIAQRPVCVDFRDGRVVSFRPGQRFEIERSNSSVLRLVRTRAVRQLSTFEQIPVLPVKLGAPKRVQSVLKARAQVEAAKQAARARLEASRRAPAKIEEAKQVPAPLKKTKNKPKKRSELSTDLPKLGSDN